MKAAANTPEPLIIPAGKFKATCLELLDRSARGESVTITKRGKVVGRLVPPEPPAGKEFVPLLGRMKGQIQILGDIVSPDFEPWKDLDGRSASAGHACVAVAHF